MASEGDYFTNKYALKQGESSEKAKELLTQAVEEL